MVFLVFNSMKIIRCLNLCAQYMFMFYCSVYLFYIFFAWVLLWWHVLIVVCVQPLPILHVASLPLFVVVTTISNAQKPLHNKQCASRHRMNLNSSADLANKTWKTLFVMYKVAITDILPSVPTYTARHPQLVFTRIGLNSWPYNMVISLVGFFVGRKFVLHWLKIPVVNEPASRYWLVTTLHLLITFVQILLPYFVHSHCSQLRSENLCSLNFKDYQIGR